MTLSALFRPSFLAKFVHKRLPLSHKEQSTWTSVTEILKNEANLNQKLTVKGWVKSSRKMKGLIFVDINDGSGPEKLQIVIPKELKPDQLSFGSALEARGTVTVNSNKQKELLAEEVKLTGTCDSTSGYPFAAKKCYPEDYVRQYLHFRPRYSTFASILRLRDAAMRGLHDILGQMDYICVNTPILTANDCEGAGEVFSVMPHNKTLLSQMNKNKVPDEEGYFGCNAFLTVSGQLQLEAAVRGLGKVYTFGPVFRAENSKSRLHLSEFYMLEAEIAFSEDIEDPMTLAERLVRGMAQKLLLFCKKDLEYLGKNSHYNLIERLEKIVTGPPFPRLTYTEAIDVLEKHGKEFEIPVSRGNNLKKEHELFLSNYCMQEMKQDLVFVTHWPANIKPFYMKHNDSSQALAFDLLGPICGELCGGSVREPNPSVIEKRLASEPGGKEALKALDWYLDIRRHGNVPTSGFGIGFERLLQSMLGVNNIKDVLPFPRGPHNLKM